MSRRSRVWSPLRLFCWLSAFALSCEALPAVIPGSGGASTNPSPSCDLSACPTPLCADPTPPPAARAGAGGSSSSSSCCPSCEASKCHFRGCVHWADSGPQWRPDPCTLCTCANGSPQCSAVHAQCQPPQCFDLYPLKSGPGLCCPECNYGIAMDQCTPVVVANVTLTAAEEGVHDEVVGGGNRCEAAVLLHKCDKKIAVSGGKTFTCHPVTKDIVIQPEKCEGEQKLTYRDVVDCKLVPANIMDYDFNPSRCEMHV